MADGPARTGANAIADARRRILAACLWSPSRFLPLVRAGANGSSCLDATTRTVLSLIRLDDHDQVSLDVSDRLEGNPAWPGGLLPEGADPLTWLPDIERDGRRENEGTVRALITQLQREHRRLAARARVLRAAQQLDESPDDLRGILGEVEADAHQALVEDNPGLRERFVAGARTLEQMRANPAPVPESILGDRKSVV